MLFVIGCSVVEPSKEASPSSSVVSIAIPVPLPAPVAINTVPSKFAIKPTFVPLLLLVFSYSNIPNWS